MFLQITGLLRRRLVVARAVVLIRGSQKCFLAVSCGSLLVASAINLAAVGSNDFGAVETFHGNRLCGHFLFHVGCVVLCCLLALVLCLLGLRPFAEARILALHSEAQPFTSKRTDSEPIWNRLETICT